MPKPGYYAVQKGRVPGVYGTWDECKAQVTGYSGAVYKKFSTLEAAQVFAQVDRVDRESSGPSGSGNEAPLSATMAIETLQRTNRARSSAAQVESAPTGAQHGEDYGEDGTTRIVYTDGACTQNGTPRAAAGIGVWWGYEGERATNLGNLSERCPGAQTNNRAELIALIRTLETAPPGEGGGKSRLVIRTDSKYSINCVRLWARKWEAAGWVLATGGTVKNADLIQYLLTLLSLRAVAGEMVDFVHVYGHRGEVGNEEADHLARLGTVLPRVPDRDWSGEKERLENEIQRRLASRRTGAVLPSISDYLGFEIDESDLLTPEEMDALEKSQEF